MTGYLVSAVVVATTLTTGDLSAGVRTCVSGDGTVFSQEKKGSGRCEAGVRPIRFSGMHKHIGPQRNTGLGQSVLMSENVSKQTLSSRPFASASRMVPALSYHDLSPGMRAKGWNIPNKGDIQLLQVDVSYVPSGDGPHLATDHHFMNGARQALAVAVMAAAKATGYNPRFLHVNLSIPMVAGSFHRGVRVDGGSAGAVWAVAVVSAILGDEVRQDLCFSGTINMNLIIGHVGGLEDKIEGCHMLPQFQELMVPAGQGTFSLEEKGMGRSINVTEVSTLAEAYEVATGQYLRFAQ